MQKPRMVKNSKGELAAIVEAARQPWAAQWAAGQNAGEKVNNWRKVRRARGAEAEKVGIAPDMAWVAMFGVVDNGVLQIGGVRTDEDKKFSFIYAVENGRIREVKHDEAMDIVCGKVDISEVDVIADDDIPF